MRILIAMLLLLATSVVPATSSQAAFDRSHGGWNRLLGAHVQWNAAGKATAVDYAGFSRDQALGDYLKSAASVGSPEVFDVFADRRIPPALRTDPLLLGECLAGALYTEDFRRLLGRIGCNDARSVSQSPIALLDAQIEARIGMVGFRSITMRAFNLPLEDRCEDYGQTATYCGSIAGLPHAFVLDDHHRFDTGRPMLVCGNTFDMLAQSRYADHFRLSGDTSVHFGLFDCATGPAGASAVAGACC